MVGSRSRKMENGETTVSKRSTSPSRMRKGRLALVVGPLCVLLLGGALFWAHASGAFALDRVYVSATEHVTHDEVAQAMIRAKGFSLFSLSTNELEQELMRIPYVKEAHVHRRFPNAIDAEIVERKPLALVEVADGSQWLVGENGRLLEETVAGDADLSDWLLVIPDADQWVEAGDLLSPQVVRALDVVSELGSNGESWLATSVIEDIRVRRTGEVVIRLVDGGEVRLGDPVGLDDKLKVSEEIIKRYLREGKALDYLDVHMPGKAVAKAKDS